MRGLKEKHIQAADNLASAKGNLDSEKYLRFLEGHYVETFDWRSREEELKIEVESREESLDVALTFLSREYQYHQLRADEIADFLEQKGIGVRSH